MALAHRDIMLELGQARCRDIIKSMSDKEKVTYDALTGCWLSDMAQNSDGYIDIKRYTNQQIAQAQAAGRTLEAMFGRNGGKHYYLHRIGYVAHYGRNLQDQASHICNAPNCVRGNHIADETGQVNHSRTQCKGPGLLDDANHLLGLTPGPNNCRHQPPCFPSRIVVLACPHPPPYPQPWSVPESRRVNIAQWFNGASLTPALPPPPPPAPPPPVVQQASQEGLFSDEITEEDNQSSPIVMPSSPPLGYQTQYARPSSSTAAPPPLELPSSRRGSSSRPGSSSSALPVRPGRPPQLPLYPGNEVPDSEDDPSSGN